MVNFSFSQQQNSEFQRYLNLDKDSMFFLDLSNCSLIECIKKMCEIKSRSHPKIYNDYCLSIQRIKCIETQYNCTIWPVTISSIFWNLFVPHLADANLKYSTINNIKSKIICVSNWASKYGVKLNPSYTEVEIPNYIPCKIALTPDEISHIYHFKVGSKKAFDINKRKYVRYRKNKIQTLERVRDMFVLGCNLGQRFSDMVRITPDNFKNGVFSITQQKTGNRCKVEIDSMAIDKKMVYSILEKYNYYAPYKGDINNFNRYLHELLYNIGEEFHDDITLENKINGNITTEIKKKYQLISSHSARRSFATINTIRNVSRSKILRATGHSSEKSFVRYICYDDDIS